MSCDWETAKAVVTKFKTPEDYTVFTFGSVKDLRSVVLLYPLDREIHPYRNPVGKFVGCICEESKTIWRVAHENLTDPDEQAFIQDFNKLAEFILSIRREAADLN